MGDMSVAQAAHIEPEHFGFAAFQRQFAVERFEQRTFTATHLTDNIDKVVFVDAEVDVFEHFLIVLIQLYVLKLNEHDDRTWIWENRGVYEGRHSPKQKERIRLPYRQLGGIQR